MTITIIQNTDTIKKVLPKNFQYGKVYQTYDAGRDTLLVIACRPQGLDGGSVLVGIGLDAAATLWYAHDTGREFHEVDIEIKVTC